MRPFNPNPMPPDFIDWVRLMPLTVQANRALARFDGILEGVPNPEVLLTPLTTNEAVLSSKIEGTRATLGEVLRYEAGDEPQQEDRREDIHEIMNYRAALRTARGELENRPFSLNLLKQLHDILLSSVRGRDKSRGRFRTIQNWIGARGASMEQSQFIPPEPGRIPELIGNWESYYHHEEIDPLVQLAVVHAQFEIIHPFLDGNGRIGRILIPLFLYEKELLSAPMFYISAYLESHREDYVEHLRQLDNEPESWHLWIEFFLKAVVEQAEKNMATARGIMELYARLKERVLELTHSQYAVPLLDHFFHQPFFTSSQIDLGPNGPTFQTISALLRKLRDENILQVVREGSGRRPQIFALGELVVLCEPGWDA